MKLLLKSLWRHLTSKRKKQLGLIMILMLLASVAEVVSIGAVVPFLAAIADPETIFRHEYTQQIVDNMELTDPDQLLLPLTAIFCVAALLAGIMRVALVWGQTRLAHAIGADLSYQIYKRTLFQPYTVHVARNSSEVIAGVSTKADQVVGYIILPVMIIISSFLMITMVLLTLLAINPVMSIAAMLGFASIYGLFIFLTKKRLIANSKQISRKTNQVIKVQQEGLGGIRDVLIDGAQATYCRLFRLADIPRRRAVANNQIMGQSPRHGVESLGIVLIAILAFNMGNVEGGLVGMLPQLGALAIGMQRMLPMFQQAYGAWSSMRGGQSILYDALELLEQPLPEYNKELRVTPISFQHSITLERVSFRYRDDAPWVLSEFDLEIEKGANIGFIGTTGSGKSTLLDVLMALLNPTNGDLKVDGVTVTDNNHRGWQSHIAHIPQVIFLSDATIAENIAFGLPKNEIDYAQVEEAAKQAQIHETIMMWKSHYDTEVGERGVRLSGGQRQRIGIARALYKQADVLILDEATSALDNSTEKAVMNAIHENNKDITILMVAHRLSTLQACDQVIELENGNIKRQVIPSALNELNSLNG